MKLTSNDLFLLSQCAISAAYQAGSIISKRSSRPVLVQTKKGGSSLASQVVTEVDHLCQDIILQTLLPTCDIFDLALLTEESPDDLQRLEKDFFWCIDPLDGTLPFTQSTPGYSVSIALVSVDGTPYLGVIYDPVKQTLYHAVKDCGAFRNGKLFTQKTSSPDQPFSFISDRSFVQHCHYSNVLDELKKLNKTSAYDTINTIHHGGAVMNACWVLENFPACYCKFPKPEEGGGNLWDYAATACLFQEAGAVVCDMFGKPLDLNCSNSTFMNHRGVLYACNKATATAILGLYATL